jgi:hypothetical protein
LSLYYFSYGSIIIIIIISDAIEAINRLKTSTSVGLDDIPGLVIKGCSDAFVPVLKHIFNLSLSQQCFPTPWKQIFLKSKIDPYQN